MSDCMKSFQIRIANNSTLVAGAAGVSLRTWGTAGQYFFSGEFNTGGNNSIYNLTGFKNVNLFGMSVSAHVRGNSGSTNKCAVVEDWAFNIGLDGTPPLISGAVGSPDGWSLIARGPQLTGYSLSKHTNTIMLSDPITSVKSILFASFYIQGVGAEFLNEVSINYNLNFTFYYKYEGED